ncbi:MAG: hypothetical protein VX733_11240 [Candidatus Latescibacterota bacterium]|nr:hypothetical protein [Candidatus Latescibacterota bacterium]
MSDGEPTTNAGHIIVIEDSLTVKNIGQGETLEEAIAAIVRLQQVVDELFLYLRQAFS